MNFTLACRSRSKKEDYSWHTPPPTDVKDQVKDLFSNIGIEGCTRYALGIQKSETGDCQIAMQVPVGKNDNKNRIIRLELWIGGLNEKQARAFAAAYLDFDLEEDGTRNWLAAKNTYQVEDDYTYKLDVPSLQNEIEKILNQFQDKLQNEQPTKRIEFIETYDTQGGLSKDAQKRLLSHQLSPAPGIKVLLMDDAIEDQDGADVLLRVDSNNTENKTIEREIQVQPTQTSSTKSGCLPMMGKVWNETKIGKEAQKRSKEVLKRGKEIRNKIEKWVKQTSHEEPQGKQEGRGESHTSPSGSKAAKKAKEMEEKIVQQPNPPSPRRPWVERNKCLLGFVVVIILIAVIVLPCLSVSKPTLIFKDVPAGYRVIIDGKMRGITPCEIPLSESDREFEIQGAPYGCILILNNKVIGKTPCKYSVPATRGEISLLQPTPPHPQPQEVPEGGKQPEPMPAPQDNK